MSDTWHRVDEYCRWTALGH